MGCASSQPEIQDVSTDKLASLNKELVAEGFKAVSKNSIKLLFLGAGESGKSTLFKQMKILHKGGYSRKEREDYIMVVHDNVLGSVRALEAAFDPLGVDMPAGKTLEATVRPSGSLALPSRALLASSIADLQEYFDSFNAIATADHHSVDQELCGIINKIWHHDATRSIYERRNEFDLQDSCDYFLDNIARVTSDGYLPSDDDVLHTRVRTTGIVHSEFKIKGFQFDMFDLGGQRRERRKWIHTFSAVDAVVFVAALSEYDQNLAEDVTKNRMDESLDLWGQIANSKWFKDTSMLLFLNKKDIFAEKIKKKPLKLHYPSAKDDDTLSEDADFQKSTDYVKERFLAKSGKKTVYTHVTCATDTSNVKFVFTSVVKIILEENMKSSGL